MSAYALPGFFPPLPKQYDFAPPPSSDFELYQFVECREDSSSSAQVNDSNDRVGISVKEAKIDSALLVKSLAKSKSDKSATTSPRLRRKIVGGEKNVDTGSGAEDEAMKFELSVAVGGRKYTTTRSWPSICRFRKDLIRNLRSYEIPELPSLHPPGVLCRSFSFLHNLVSSYCPTLEGWLKDITALVPHDNPILSHFLFEAEKEDASSSPVLEKELEKRSNSSTHLDSIEESEIEEDEEEL